MIIQRDDGKMIWAPYSVDISAGQDWYTGTPLTGDNSIARGCQSDPQCWADTISTCEKLIAKFDKLNPEKIVDQTKKLLGDLDMMRDGDAARAKSLREWYVQRQTELSGELERYRYLPDQNNECPDGLELCGIGGDDYYGQQSCGTEEQCVEWRCPVRAKWCESFSQCIGYDQPCVDCEDETPFYCPPTESCVTSRDECNESCGQPGYVYCPSYGGCVPAYYCDYVDVDGGVSDGGFDGSGGGGVMGPDDGNAGMDK